MPILPIQQRISDFQVEASVETRDEGQQKKSLLEKENKKKKTGKSLTPSVPADTSLSESERKNTLENSQLIDSQQAIEWINHAPSVSETALKKRFLTPNKEVNTKESVNKKL